MFGEFVKPEWSSFHPEKEMNKSQIWKVMKRAGLEDITRAEFSTFMRGGTDALEEIRCPPGEANRPSANDCSINLNGWHIKLDKPALTWTYCGYKYQSWCDYSDYFHVNVVAVNRTTETGFPPSSRYFKLFSNNRKYANTSSDCADTIYPIEVGIGETVSYNICIGHSKPIPESDLVLQLSGGYYGTDHHIRIW